MTTSETGKIDIRITSRRKSKLVGVSEKTHGLLAVLKIFYPATTPVKLGRYQFRISEIDPWPPAPPPENTKLL